MCLNRDTRWPKVMLVCMALAMWPVWRWEFFRFTDGSDDPHGILALATFAAICWKRGVTLPKRETGFLAAGLLLVCYICAFGALAPLPLPRALLATAAFGAVLLRDRDRAGCWVLLALALPVVASVQFYLGFPLRLGAAEVSLWFLRLLGFAVSREGTTLRWHGEAVMVDAPCSGVHMLWFGLYLAASLAAWRRLAISRTGVLMIAAAVIVVGANMLRATALFFKEAGVVHLPNWTHAAVGVVIFAGAAFAIVRLARPSARHAADAADDVAPRARQEGVVVWRTGVPVAWIIRSGFVGSCVFAAFAPCWERSAPWQESGFVAWRTELEGELIQRVPLTAREVEFAGGFPGLIAKFTDGHREFVMRSVREASRKLHSSADCYRALGYTVSPEPALRDASGAQWGCFIASRGPDRLHVRERITDADGRAWTDVSAWFWGVVVNQSRGPWLAVTVVER